MGKRKSGEDLQKAGTLKVKLKIGKQFIQNIETPYINVDEEYSVSESDNESEVDVESNNVNTKKLSYDEEEQIWLDALEKGELDDSGDIKRDKDLSLMTARQRSLMQRMQIGRKSRKKVMYLPVLTEEDKKKREERNKKRKLQATKKAEESQKITIQRLVKHQGGKPSKNSKERQKKVATNNSSSSTSKGTEKEIVKMIKYLNNRNTITISFPEGLPSTFLHTISSKQPEAKSCCICKKPKKYNCSKTKMPLCSLACYKINLNETSMVT